MNFLTSFWQAIVFWLKDLRGRFFNSRSSGGFVQVPVVVFLALMALALPVAVKLVQNQQDTRERAVAKEAKRMVVEEGDKTDRNPDGSRARLHGYKHDGNVYNASDSQ